MRRTPHRSTVLKPVCMIAFVLIFPAPPAYAYIDPGSGSFLLQMILAGIAGAAFYFRELVAGALRKIFGRDQMSNVMEDSKLPQEQDPES